MNLYPIRFKEHIRNYGFGDRWIVTAYEKTGLPTDNRVAETWEVVDRKGESSVVTNGLLAGKNLHELIQMYGVHLLGRDIIQFSKLLKGEIWIHIKLGLVLCLLIVSDGPHGHRKCGTTVWQHSPG